jgi:hypothetical protein
VCQPACFQIAGSEGQAFVFIDEEFYLKTGLAFFGGRIRGEEGWVVFVHPEHAALFMIVGGQGRDTRRAAGVEDQFHRLMIRYRAAAARSIRKLRFPTAFVLVYRRFHRQALDGFNRRIGCAAFYNSAVIMRANLRVDKTNGVIMLNMVEEIDSRDKGGCPARNGIQRTVEHHPLAPKDLTHRALDSEGIWLLPPTISTAWMSSSRYPRSLAPASAARMVWLISV